MNVSETRGSDAKAIIEAIERLKGHEAIEGVEDAIIVSSHTGQSVVDLRPMLDKRLERPRRAHGTSQHTTIESIIRHANRQKIDRSAIFASDDPRSPSLTVVYNYDDTPSGQSEADSGEPTSERADYRDHRAHYAFPLSEEWLAWAAVSGENAWLPQAAFAELIESRILDVLDPERVPEGAKDTAVRLGFELATPASLMSCSRGISVNATRAVTQTVNLSTGETEISFAETHAGKGGARVIVPQSFALQLPVFRGGEKFVVLARLRYREADGTVRWGVRLHRPDICFRTAFTEACERAAKETALPLFYGSPES